MRSKGIVLLMLVAVLVVVATAPALAARAENTSDVPAEPVPMYEVRGDQLIVDGDVSVDCPSTVRYAEQRKDAARYAELCQRYGYSPDGDAVVERDAVPAPGSETLPNTGGPPVGVIAGLLASAVGLTACRMVR